MGLINIIAQTRARLFDFEGGKVAKSADVDAEYNQLISANNDLVTDIETLNTAMDTITGVGWVDATLQGNKETISTHKTSTDHDGRYYTETEIDTKLSTRDTNLNTHKGSTDHDGRYYTETEIDTKLSTRDTNINTHKTSADHDIRYNTKAELQATNADTIIGATVGGLIGTTIHEVFISLRDKVQDAVDGSIPDGTITDLKLSDEVTAVKPRLAVAETAIDAHDNSAMPHIMNNLQNGKRYRYGYRLSATGVPQVISQEVI